MNKVIVRMRDMKFSRSHSSTLRNSALVPEVGSALSRWADATKGVHGVLIGGLALAFYSKPRETTDVDVLFLSHADIPKAVDGFKRHRTSAFEDKATNVEIEPVSASTINVPQSVVDKVFATARMIDGMNVASLEGLIVLKLYGMLSPKREFGDKSDIQRLLEADPNASVSGWPLTAHQKAVLEKIRAVVLGE